MSLLWLKIKNVAQNDVRPNFFLGGIKTSVRRADEVHTFQKMGLFLSELVCFLRLKNNAKLHKITFFKNEPACACLNMVIFFTPLVSIYGATHLYNFTVRKITALSKKVAKKFNGAQKLYGPLKSCSCSFCRRTL